MLPLGSQPFRQHDDAVHYAFSAWLEDKGKPILAAEQRLLADYLPSLVGETALEVCVGKPLGMLKAAKHTHCWQLSRQACATIRANPSHWPIARRAVDLVLLHHSLDFADNPHQVINGAARSLSASGILIVIGFQPLSLWGLWRLFTKRRTVPWCARHVSANKVSEWLSVLGCEVEQVQSACFGWPQRVEQGVWQRLGARFWPRYGAIYMLVARRRTAMIRPLPQRSGAMAMPPVVGVSMNTQASNSSECYQEKVNE